MNSWHSFSPNGRWLVFSSKWLSPYTDMFLTHLDDEGHASPPVLVTGTKAANRAINIPEFVNVAYDQFLSIQAPTVEYYRHFNRGVELAKEEHFEEAIVEYRQALAAEPTSTMIHNNLGELLAKTGAVDEAESHFRAALEVNPRYALVHANLGFVLLAENRLEEAVEHLRTAAEIDPRLVTPHKGMGIADAMRGRFAAAAAHFQHALELDPGDRFARSALDGARRGQARLEESARAGKDPGP